MFETREKNGGGTGVFFVANDLLRASAVLSSSRWYNALQTRTRRICCMSHALAFLWFSTTPLSQFNPLSFWSFEDCWTYLRRHNAPYHPLHDVGFSSLGDMQSTRKVCVPAGSIAEGTAAVWRVLRSAAAILCSC